MTSVVLGSLAAIAYGRANWSSDVDKSARYAEFAILLVPLTAVLWHHILWRRPVARVVVLTSYFIILCVTFADDWNFREYREISAHRVRAVHCLAAAWRGSGLTDCPTFLPGPAFGEKRLELARHRRISLYQKVGEPRAESWRDEAGSSGPRGFQEHTVIGPRWTTVSGWALSTGTTPTIALRHRDRTIEIVGPTVRRAEVADSLGIDRATPLGFVAKVRTSDVLSAELDGLQAWIVDGPSHRKLGLLYVVEGENLLVSDGRRFTIDESLLGSYTEANGKVSGFAIDRRTQRPASRIVVLFDSIRTTTTARPRNPRPFLAADYGADTVRSGFTIYAPPRPHPQVFAVNDYGHASRLMREEAPPRGSN